jgi:predicted dehydrogenase
MRLLQDTEDRMANTTVALIGYGYWGPNLLRNYMELPTADVKWVCDSRPERLAKAAERYPAVGITAQITDVLDDPQVDAVLIATPPSA